MAFMALRILRMSMIVVKEFTQPFKSIFKHIAKNNNFFRKYICKPPAYGYEWCENTLHMLITKDTKIEPLTEKELINLGSAIWAEVVVFIGCSKVLLLETNRQAKHKETTDKEFLKQEQNIIEAVEVLQNILKQQQFYIEQIVIALKELGTPIKHIEKKTHQAHDANDVLLEI
uniref:Optic atrophy 3 protein n=1 Tax=Ceratitis capitata TaxID=7213 RepID=W8AVU5_CERCA